MTSEIINATSYDLARDIGRIFAGVHRSQREYVAHTRHMFLANLGVHAINSVDVSDTTDSEVAQLCRLLVLTHPRSADKFRDVGMPTGFELCIDSYGYVALMLYFADGSYDDMSWVKASQHAARIIITRDRQRKTRNSTRAGNYQEKFVLGPNSNAVYVPGSVTRTRYYEALRKVIRHDIEEFRQAHKKQNFGKYVCEVSGNVVAPIKSHVDHYPVSFADLVQQWLQSQGLADLEDISIADQPGSHQGWVMSDPKQIKSWAKFHRQHARYRLLDASLHLHLKDGQRA